MITLLTVIGASSLHADDARVAKLEARIDALEKEIHSLKTLKISQEDFVVHSGLQDEINSFQAEATKKQESLQAPFRKEMEALQAKYADAKDDAKAAIEADMMKVQQKASEAMKSFTKEMQTKEASIKDSFDRKVKQANEEAKKLGFGGGAEIVGFPVAKDHPHYSVGQKVLATLKKGIKAVEADLKKL